MPPTNDVPMSRVNASKAEADRMRAQWRIGLTRGKASLEQLFGAACHPDGAPLLRLRLLDVLTCLPDLALAQARHALAHLREHTGVPAGTPDRDLTVYWLLDPRSSPGARLAALADALCMVRGSRVALVEATGWPFAPVEVVAP